MAPKLLTSSGSKSSSLKFEATPKASRSPSKNSTSFKKFRRASGKTSLVVGVNNLKRRHSYQVGDAAAHEGESPIKSDDQAEDFGFAASKTETEAQPRRRSFMAEVLEITNAPKRNASFLNAHKIRQVYSHARRMDSPDADGEQPRRRSFQDTALGIKKSLSKTRREIQVANALLTVTQTRRGERLFRQHFLELTRTSTDADGVLEFGTLSEHLSAVNLEIGEMEEAHVGLDFEDLKGRVLKAQLEALNLQKAKDDVSRYTRELQSCWDNGLAEKNREEWKNKLAAAQKAKSRFIRCNWDMRKCFYDCGMLDVPPDDEGRDFISGVVQEIRLLPDEEVQSLKHACLHAIDDSCAIQEVTLLNITRLQMKLDKAAVHKVLGELRRVFWEAEVDSEFGKLMKQQQEILDSLESVIGNAHQVRRPSDVGREIQRSDDILADEVKQEERRTATTIDVAVHNMDMDSTEVPSRKEANVTDQGIRRKRPMFVERRLKRRVTTGMLNILTKDMITGDLRIDYASSWSLRDKLITGMLFGDVPEAGDAHKRRSRRNHGMGRAYTDGHECTDEATANRRTFPAAPADAESKALVEVSMSLTLDEPSTERRVVRNARRRATHHQPARAQTLQTHLSSPGGSVASSSRVSSVASSSRVSPVPDSGPKWRSEEPAVSTDPTWQKFNVPQWRSEESTASTAPIWQQSIPPKVGLLSERHLTHRARPGATGEDVSSVHLPPQGPLPSQRADVGVRLPSLRPVTAEIVAKDHWEMHQRWKYVRMQRQRACGRSVACVAWLRDARETFTDKMIVSMHLPEIRGNRSKADGGHLNSKILFAHRMVSPGRRANTAFRRTRDRWNMLS